MQVIFEDEDERNDNRRVSTVDSVLHTGRISRYIEGKYVGRFGS